MCKFLNTLSAKKADDKICLPNFKIVLSKLYHTENSRLDDSVDIDEVADYEPLHHDLCCVQIQLFLFFGAFNVKFYFSYSLFGGKCHMCTLRTKVSLRIWVNWK